MTEQEALQFGYTPEEIANERKRQTEAVKQQTFDEKYGYIARPIVTTAGAIGGGMLGAVPAMVSGPGAVPAGIAGAAVGEMGAGAAYDYFAGRQSDPSQPIKDFASGAFGGILGPALKAGAELIPKALGSKAITNLGSKYFTPENINNVASGKTAAVIEGLGGGVNKAEQSAFSRFPKLQERFKADYKKYSDDWDRFSNSGQKLAPKMNAHEFKDEWLRNSMTGMEKATIEGAKSARTKAINAIRNAGTTEDATLPTAVGSLGGLLLAGLSNPSVAPYLTGIMGAKEAALAATAYGVGKGVQKGATKFAKPIAKSANTVAEALKKNPKATQGLMQFMLGGVDYAND